MSEAKEPTLLEALRSVPEKATYDHEEKNQFHLGSTRYPVGPWCKRAADEIERLEGELAEAKQRVDMLKDEKAAMKDNMLAIVNAGTKVRLLLLRCEGLLRENGIELPTDKEQKG